MIVVPPGVNPGDSFCLEIHHNPEGGATVIVAEVSFSPSNPIPLVCLKLVVMVLVSCRTHL